MASNQEYNNLLIMCNNFKIYHLVNEDGTHYTIDKTFDYSGHISKKDVMEFRRNEWFNAYICDRTLSIG